MNSPLTSLAVALAVALSPCAHAIPDPVRLYEISVVRFTHDESGRHWSEHGLLDSLGLFTPGAVEPVPESVTIPPEILGRTVISIEAWLAYGRLSSQATGNFAVDEAHDPIFIGQRSYQLVAARPDAVLDLGDAVNVSARAVIAPGAEPLIGGFVIENQHRWVLIRGVGPGTSAWGVATPVEDPYIVLYKNGSSQFQFFNDNWGQRFDADEIERVAAQVGAFPLARGSKDAALLIELAPGAYTVHLATDGPAGTGLLEVYVVP